MFGHSVVSLFSICGALHAMAQYLCIPYDGLKRKCPSLRGVMHSLDLHNHGYDSPVLWCGGGVVILPGSSSGSSSRSRSRSSRSSSSSRSRSRSRSSSSSIIVVV